VTPTATDEAFLLDLLNTTPVVDGTPRDDLADAATARRWLTDHHQPATDPEWRALLAARTALQDVVRGAATPSALAPFVAGVRHVAALHGEGIAWTLELPPGRAAAASAVLAWDALRRTAPGRLRPCANPDCRLFLIDHSKPNRARWCSMAACGNRMKARRHYERTKAT
jgi:predicted RNA-binding Zn ribbon-like protein